MSYFSESRAQEVIEDFLTDLRRTVRERSLKESHLPPWIVAARVRVGWISDSLVSVFEAAIEGDSYQILGAVHADTVVLMNTEDSIPSGASLKALKTEPLVILSGTRTDTIINMVGERPAVFDCGYAGYHGPRALCDLFFQHKPKGREADPIMSCFVPFALYLHRRDVSEPGRVWALCQQHLMNHLVQIHDSAEGDSYEHQHGPRMALFVTKKSDVIVLGKDSVPELYELREVQSHLQKKGYNAQLVKDIPDISEMSNEEKVRFWGLACRFCVMVDRIPAGHVAEYMILREQRSILVVLRPDKSGSTYMIGDDTLVDVNHIRIFSFDRTPLDMLDEAIEWAEKTAQERAKAYDAAYPWRHKQM
jgi:hypothetical protein